MMISPDSPSVFIEIDGDDDGARKGTDDDEDDDQHPCIVASSSFTSSSSKKLNVLKAKKSLLISKIKAMMKAMVRASK